MIVVFLGPSLPLAQARDVLEAEYMPPAAQGDVYRASRREPEAIVIIDGYFDATPSVWHKEVLWALTEGIAVYGASSMGALRAAELSRFGMIGIGEVYGRFASGELEDDDEVAVWHADAASGYRRLSDAMIDIRFSFERAAQAGVLEATALPHVIAAAKNIHYKERTYATALAQCEGLGILDPAAAEALRAWGVAGFASQKQRDAVTALELLATGQAPKAQAEPFSFANTGIWNDFRVFYGDSDIIGEPNDGVSLEELLDEVRLHHWYHDLQSAALLRLLTLREFRRRGYELPADDLRAFIERFRRERDLISKAALEEWSLKNGLTFPDGLTKYLNEQARVEWIRQSNAENAWAHFIAVLRERGDYRTILARARAKKAFFADASRALLPRSEVADETILEWYATTSPAGASEDGAGFAFRSEFLRAVRREYFFALHHAAENERSSVGSR